MAKGPFSVIVTAYRSAKYLPACLDSIYQALSVFDRDWEIVIGVDGCQETLNAALTYPIAANTSVYWFPDNVGTYIVSNTLISLARYETIIRFDSDDIMLPEFARLIENAPEWPAIVCAPMRKFKEDKIPKRSQFHLCKASVAGGVVIITPGALKTLGGYRPWRCAADSDLTYRARCAGVGLVTRKTETTFLRRSHAESLTRLPETSATSELRKHYHELTKASKELYVEPVTAPCVMMLEATK